MLQSRHLKNYYLFMNALAFTLSGTHRVYTRGMLPGRICANVPPAFRLTPQFLRWFAVLFLAVRQEITAITLVPDSSRTA